VNSNESSKRLADAFVGVHVTPQVGNLLNRKLYYTPLSFLASDLRFGRVQVAVRGDRALLDLKQNLDVDVMGQWPSY